MSLDTIVNKITEFFGAESGGPAIRIPDPGALIENAPVIARVLVVAGPVVMIVMGLLYLFAAPKEANHHFGYRCYFGMGSELAWRFTQHIAGVTWIVLGVVLTVTMLIITSRFPGSDVLDMLTTAALCVLAEAGVLVLASIVIRTIVAARYDRHGERRVHKTRSK